MKVNDVNRIQGINKYQQFGKQNEDQNLKQSKSRKDQVSISDEAKALLEQSKGSDTSSDKINQLKEEVNNGTYKVDSYKVADSMIETMYKK